MHMDNPHYNQKYTRKEIKDVLDKFKDCVKSGRYIISLNNERQENIAFIQRYNIRDEKKREILLQIQCDDFAHSLRNTKEGYEHEVLYVFVPQVELFNADGYVETVNVYVKINIIERSKGDRVVVISFHKANKPVNYLFR